jgi:hypothetical protein
VIIQRREPRLRLDLCEFTLVNALTLVTASGPISGDVTAGCSKEEQMSTLFDGPAPAIKSPGPDPPAGTAPPPHMGWLARTYCRVAGHTGDWTYPDERCLRFRMCRRCGAATSKQEHTWNAFGYLAADRCEQERRCDRCGAVESRVLHRWGPFLYGLDNYFVFQVCGRCGAVDKSCLGVPTSGMDTRKPPGGSAQSGANEVPHP